MASSSIMINNDSSDVEELSESIDLHLDIASDGRIDESSAASIYSPLAQS